MVKVKGVCVCGYFSYFPVGHSEPHSATEMQRNRAEPSKLEFNCRLMLPSFFNTTQKNTNQIKFTTKNERLTTRENTDQTVKAGNKKKI